MKNLKFFIIAIIGIIFFYQVKGQDKLIFRDGKVQEVYIQKETANDIYFLKTKEDNKTYFVQKHDLKEINYRNGQTLIISEKYYETADTIVRKIPEKKPEVRKGIYNCWLFTDINLKKYMRRGFIQSTGDSGITFVVSAKGNSFFFKDSLFKFYNASNIDQIKLRRKGHVGRGILIGAGIGFAIGGLLGLAGVPQYGIFSDLPPGENAIAGGVFFSIPGMIIGGIAGATRIIIPIDKDQNKYEKHKKLIASYSIIK
jgi:hypothetical protein